MIEAFVKLAELGLLVFPRLEKKSLQDFEGCWTYDIGGGWWVAMNGHREPRKADMRDAPGFGDGDYQTEVPGFSAFLAFNGWPAGVIDPGGGAIAAGTVANEDALLEALDAAIRREQVPV